MLDSRNSLVRSEESMLTTVVGLDDIDCRVDRGCRAGCGAREGRAGQDAGRAAQGAAIVARRSSTAASIVLGATTRTWTSAPRYQVKRIVVKPGSKLSLQKHFHRAEHWVVVKGTAEVTLGSDVRSRA